MSPKAVSHPEFCQLGLLLLAGLFDNKFLYKQFWPSCSQKYLVGVASQEILIQTQFLFYTTMIKICHAELVNYKTPSTWQNLVHKNTFVQVSVYSQIIYGRRVATLNCITCFLLQLKNSNSLNCITYFLLQLRISNIQDKSGPFYLRSIFPQGLSNFVTTTR